MLLHVDVLRRLREQAVEAQATLERLGQNGQPVPLQLLPVS